MSDPEKEEQTTFEVWHVARFGVLHLVATGLSEAEAQEMADILQEMSYAGQAPKTFYMIAPYGQPYGIPEPNDFDYLEVLEAFKRSERGTL